MIDINELRRLAQTVQSPTHNIDERMDALNTLHNTLTSGVVLELLDRLKAAESDGIEQARLNGMGSEREAALMAKLEAAEKERDALRTELADLRSSMTFRTSLIGRIEAERDALQAKVETMERQEPVAWRRRSDYGWSYKAKPVNGLVLEPLYLAPGAQPAPNLPVDLITDYLVSISAHVAHQDDPKAQAEIGELLRILAAAPEAKP